MPFELQDVVNDYDLADNFTILRSEGSFVAGGWQDKKTSIPVWGVVTVATDKQLQMIPEADRVTGARMFLCEQPLYTTSEMNSGTSDILVWGNQQYRVLSVGPYENRGGYYCAIASRMSGS